MSFNLPDIIDGENKNSLLANCIRNNYRHIKKWAKKSLTNCFRIYDREMSKYPFAIDYYDGKICVHFFAKEDDDPSPELIQEVEEALNIVLPYQQIFWRTRKKTKETRQYEKLDQKRDFFTVLEYDVKFKVNLVDYLDTGLFLDHRETRQRVAKVASGKRLLNLFAYTCSFSVHAAMHGAAYTKSVDMSNTYTDWGRDNFELNGLSSRVNPIIRADCLKFLETEREKYDLIVIDPPTISRSKKMDQLFDIQVDYINLITRSLKLLNPNGSIFFSTNSRKFRFDESLFKASVRNISDKTLPIDFHDPKIHQCFLIQALT
jgi:23S rRNA G2069 N7-methylase RlmK/C1962 C5-methylase RlmI